jgi:hypothetical protein
MAHAWLIANEVYVTPKGRTPYKEIFSFNTFKTITLSFPKEGVSS